MQRLVRPEAAKYRHVAGLGVLAGGGGIGDAGGDGRVRGEPAALCCLVQQAGAHIEDRVAWQQASQEQITVVGQSGPQGFPVVQVFGRIPERFVVIYPDSAEIRRKCLPSAAEAILLDR